MLRDNLNGEKSFDRSSGPLVSRISNFTFAIVFIETSLKNDWYIQPRVSRRKKSYTFVSLLLQHSFFLFSFHMLYETIFLMLYLNSLFLNNNNWFNSSFQFEFFFNDWQNSQGEIFKTDDWLSIKRKFIANIGPR